MVKETQLRKMSLKDLIALRSRVERAIGVRQEVEKTDVKDKMRKIAEDAGFEVSELFGGKGGKARGPVAPKYVHPTNPSLTWSGRGRMPKWLAEKVDKGQKRERFLIK